MRDLRELLQVDLDEPLVQQLLLWILNTGNFTVELPKVYKEQKKIAWGMCVRTVRTHELRLPDALVSRLIKV